MAEFIKIPKNRNVSEAKKKSVAGKQNFKCANKPDANITRIEDYRCPLWEKQGDNQGCFDESGYDIDHIVEHALTYDDSIKNLQALCKSCHSVKTKRFLILNNEDKKENFWDSDSHKTANDNKATCEFCNKTFSSVYGLKKHIATSNICLKKHAATSTLFLIHRSRGTPLEMPSLYNCRYCKKDYWEDDLTVHYKTCPKKREDKTVQEQLADSERDLEEKIKESEMRKKALDEAQIKIRILEEKNRELNKAYNLLKENRGFTKSKEQKQVINITNYGNNNFF